MVIIKAYIYSIRYKICTVDERYEYIKQIGLGAYGVVCSCYDKKENRNVAIKKVGNTFTKNA